MKITTNWQPRDLEMWHALPKEVQKDFDYLDEGQKFQDRFVEYKGEWYDAIDTQRIQVEPRNERRMGWAMTVEPTHPFADWDAITTESAFSGVLFKWTTDDRIIVGRYYA